MVVTFLPETCETGIEHERTGDPSTWTVHAPQRPAPQPNFVPVSSSVSRNTHSSGVSGETLTFFSLPLTSNVNSAIGFDGVAIRARNEDRRPSYSTLRKSETGTNETWQGRCRQSRGLANQKGGSLKFRNDGADYQWLEFIQMKEDHQLISSPVADLIDRRYQPRFKIEVEISVHSKSCGLIKGHTVDLSESGISALLPLELPLDELVELDFTLPFGRAVIYAVVRQRSAFRYGFQFAESNFIKDIVHPTCRVLAMQQYVSDGI